jgi:predicted permease
VTTRGAYDPVRRVALLDELLARIDALPGVDRAGLTSGFPLGGGSYQNGRFLEMTSVDEIQSEADVAALGARAQERMGDANFRVVSPGYFASMGIPLRRGRVHEAGDSLESPHVAVISQSLADAKWPGRDPIGRYVQFGNMDGDPTGFQIVGVVGDVRELTLEAPPEPTFYVSYRQRPNPIWRVNLIVRGPEPAAIEPSVRRVVREVNPELPAEFRTVEGAFEAAFTGRRFSLMLISVFGIAALLLATVGLYSLIAYLVAQRRREMGIRMALGATPGRLITSIVGRGAALAVAGGAGGLVLAVLLTGVLQGMLFGVEPLDPAVLGVVAGVTVLPAIGASYLPARRAARVSPVASLRGE